MLRYLALVLLLLSGGTAAQGNYGSFLVGEYGGENFDVILEFRGDQVLSRRENQQDQIELELLELGPKHAMIVHEKGNAHLFWTTEETFLMVIETNDKILSGLKLLQDQRPLSGRWDLPSRGQKLELDEETFSLESGEAFVQGRVVQVASDRPGCRALVLKGPHGNELLYLRELEGENLFLFQDGGNFFFGFPEGREEPTWALPFVRPHLPSQGAVLENSVEVP